MTTINRSLSLLFCLYCFVSNAQIPPSSTGYTIAPPDIHLDDSDLKLNSISIKRNENGVYVQKGTGEQIGEFYDNIQFFIRSHFVVTRANKQGVMNYSGVVVLPLIYDKIVSFRGSGFLAYDGKKCTLFNDECEQLITTTNNDIILFNDLLTVVENQTKSYDILINRKNNLLLENIQFIEIYKTHAIVKKDGKFAVVTDDIIVPFTNDSISGANETKMKVLQKIEKLHVRLSYNSEPAYFVAHGAGGKRLYSKHGKEIYPRGLRQVVCYEKQGYCKVSHGAKYGVYFTQTGDTTAFVFDKVSHDLQGFISVSKDSKQGVYDLTGKLIIPVEYDEISMNHKNDLFYVTKNCKKGICDANGKLVIPIVYDDIDINYLGQFQIALVLKDKKQGVLKMDGKVFIPIIYDDVILFYPYIVVVEQGAIHNYGLYDRNGLLYPTKYKRINKFCSSRMMYLQDFKNTITLIDDSNRVVVQNIKNHHYIHNEQYLLSGFNGWSNFYVAVQNNNKGKYGVLNPYTKEVNIPFVYDSIYQMYKTKEEIAYFVVKKGQSFGLVDQQHNIILPFQYNSLSLDLIYESRNQKITLVAEQNGKFGLIDLAGNVVIPFEYKDLKRISYSGLFKVKKDKNKYQIIDLNNNLFIQDYFDEVSNFEFAGYEEDEYGYSNVYTEKAYTFQNGYMRVLKGDGKYLSSPVLMSAHQGFKTFEELKQALIVALNDKNDAALIEFVEKIVPSSHLIHVLKQNSTFNIRSLNENSDMVKIQYIEILTNFKHNSWNAPDKKLRFDKSILTLTPYLTHVSYGVHSLPTVLIEDFFGFGNKELNLILENCIRVNGYWVSLYFNRSR